MAGASRRPASLCAKPPNNLKSFAAADARVLSAHHGGLVMSGSKLRMWLLASAAALGGSGLMASVMLGVTPLAAATDAPGLRAGLTEADFILCRTPARSSPMASLLRLAATQTEVPPTAIQAATPAPDFADTS